MKRNVLTLKTVISFAMLSTVSAHVFAVNDTVFSDQKVVSCDEYYKAPNGTFEGDVIQSGHYEVLKNEKTQQTSKKFIVDSITASCITEPKLKKETRTLSCPDGEEGIYQQYRMYIAQFNPATQKILLSYPDGDKWITVREDCKVSDEDEEKKHLPNRLVGLLKYEGVNTSEIRNGPGLDQFKKSLDASIINNYTLNLIIDNLSKDKYNAANVTKAVLMFDEKTNKTGNFNILSIPQSLISYSGYDGLNKNTLSDKILISAKVVDTNKVEVVYKTIIRNQPEVIRSFRVNLFTEDLQPANSNGTSKNSGFIYQNN